MSRPASVAMPPPSLTRQSLAELLIANLRLLDLDQAQDWPDITPKTFATKDLQQNQKQRIRCTEWVLYRLFELWDPEETRDKLQPFFPPLEPLQSLNLRGALFRSLNELKKNGLLGREAVLRKTMLDECKGEKLMELLVVFSTAVLRRSDNSSRGGVEAIAYRLASLPILSALQQGSLLPLAVAHAASLTNLLRRRNERVERFTQFNNLLDGKRLQLRERVKASVQSRRRDSGAAGEVQVQKIVQDSWSGHSRWPQALLCGDETSAGDLPLQKSFNQVWTAISEGEPLQGDSTQLGLLANLDRRVRLQKERLQMWQSFHENLKTSAGGALEDTHHVKSDQSSESTFQFDRHQHLQFSPGQAINGQINGYTTEQKNDYDPILKDLREEIAKASKSRRDGGSGWSSVRCDNSDHRTQSLFSPIKTSIPASAPQVDFGRPSHSRFNSRQNIMQDRPSLLAPMSTWRKPPSQDNISRIELQTAPVPNVIPQSNPTPTESSSDEDSPKFQHVHLSMSPGAETPSPKKYLTLPDSPIEEEQTAAERIISSMVNATPSPVKRMTLTERTRMSMAYFNVARPVEEPETVDSGISMQEPESEPIIDDQKPNRRISLLERTRLSMAALPAQPVRSKKEKRISQIFPVNQFETPGKPRMMTETRDATPKEALLSGEAEYESVFKSRPRIALSPVWSPDGPSIMGMDETIDEGEWNGGSSPLGGRNVSSTNGIGWE